MNARLARLRAACAREDAEPLPPEERYHPPV